MLKISNIPNSVAVAASLAFLLASGATVSAQNEPAGVKVGVLSCNIEGGWGYVLGSSRDLRCNFVPSDGVTERYAGEITRIGVDVGYTQGGVLIWDVVAPSSELESGALEGDYGGVSAGATVGVGFGANVMIGGFDKSVALQPLSIEGHTGLNVAAGIGAMSLDHIPS